jgi:hypothetical protein
MRILMFFLLLKHRLCLALLFACLFSLSCSGAMAEQVGTAVVDGRTVILDSNKTWRYADEAEVKTPDGCENIENLAVCVGSIGWAPATAPNSGNYAALYVHSKKYYFGIIVEPYGQKDGMTYQALQSAIIENAAHFASAKSADIPVLGTESEVKGLPGARSITYGPVLKGTPFLFYNAFKIYQDRSIQFAFWGIAKTMPADFKALIEKTLPLITDK